MLGGQIPAGSLRGCASTQVNQAGGDSAKRRGGCVGHKSRAAAQFFMTAERHPRLRGGRSEGTNIPAAVQAFGLPKKRLLFQVRTGRSAVW